jgi:basic membrane lipoprotein Med (substrate-binding protein (PBP1-ABC) superfamily)
MRPNPMVRTIITAAALTLLASSTVSAQVATPGPVPYGGTLTGAAVTNALDDASINERIETFTRNYVINQLNGKAKRWQAVNEDLSPRPSTANVVQKVNDLVAGDPPDFLVISGSDGQSDVGIAGNYRTTIFLDLGQGQPCVTTDGVPDPAGECTGESLGIPVNYSAIDFAVEDGAYLAGVLAAKKASSRLGVISGYAGCELCNRYVRGFVNGALSVKPDIDIEVAYLADDEVLGFGDPATARTFTEAFIDVYEPDVLLPVGRASTVEMVEAACDAGIFVIGTGIDVRGARPDLDCVITSVMPNYEKAIDTALNKFSKGENERVTTWDFANGGVEITEDWTRITLPVDTKEHYDNAAAAILTNQVAACGEDCALPYGLPVDEEPATEDGDTDE